MENSKNLLGQIKKYRLSMGITSLGFVAIGILFWVLQGDNVIFRITSLLGIVMAISGCALLVVFYIAKLRKKIFISQLIMGFILLVLGAVVFYNNEIYSVMIPIFMGIYMIILGVFCFEVGFISYKMAKTKFALVVTLGGAIIAIFGAVMTFNPFSQLPSVSMPFGIIMIISGVIGLLWQIYYMIVLNKLDKQDESIAEIEQ